MTTPFSQLPDTARLWIFAARDALDAARQQQVLLDLNDFIATWTSHGAAVHAAAAFEEDRFLVVGATIPGGDVSGCGTDKLFGAVRDAFRAAGTAQLDPLTFCYRDADGAVCTAPRATARTLAARGVLRPDTPVFDVALTALGAYRRGDFRPPARATWLARLLNVAPVA